MKAVLLVVVGALAACLYLVGLTLDMFWLKLLAKPWPVLVLGFAVWQSGEGRAGRMIAWGLFFGAVGDVCLALPNAFLPGMIAFAIGHGLYIAAFLRWNRQPALALLAPVLLFCAIGLALMLPGAGAFAVPLAIYVLAIGAMIWRAAACALAPGGDFLVRWSALVGALLFGLSDFLIGIHRFHQPLPGAAFTIIVTYWMAQSLLSTAAIRRSSSAAASLP